jgi:NTE family protein
VFAVNTHPLKAFSTKKRNTLEQGNMFMVKAKTPLAAPPSHDRSRQGAHARTIQLNKMGPFYRKNVNGVGSNERAADIATARWPKLGIALGAGGARGWSHIGVLLELNAQGIYPDVVAGTSIGALVGGAYAAGKLKELEDFARGLTRKRVISLMDVSFSGVSFLGGERLRRELEHEFSGLSFEDLDKKFATVATEIGSGHEIWLTKGNVADAIRASYAMPGIFEPVKINGRWLFDGALVNPIPVTLCRALGAEVVVAVNLVGDTTFRGTIIDDRVSIEPALEQYDFGTPAAGPSLRARIFGGMGGNLRRLFGKREDGAPGIGIAMMDAFNIAQGRISRSRLAGDPPDVLVNARLGTVGLFDFHRADELIAIGREATRRVIHDIAKDVAMNSPESAISPR